MKQVLPESPSSFRASSLNGVGGTGFAWSVRERLALLCTNYFLNNINC